MAGVSKGKSPFYPGQPVPVELFCGRREQLERILTRGVGQVAAGKPVAMFIEGEYGIGKSSIAGFAQYVAESDHGLHSVYAPLGGVQDLDGVAAAVLEATVRSGALRPTRFERIRNLFAKYDLSVPLFPGLGVGFSLNLEALRKDAANLVGPFGTLGLLNRVYERLRDTGVKGVFLVLDEINGITADPQFAHFVKGLVDTNAMSPQPLPLLLMLCGVGERRRELIRAHQPVERIFDVVDIGAMTEEEMVAFFQRAFESVQMTVRPKAMNLLTHWSAGFPKIMHVIGDNAYWMDQDGVIDEDDASAAVVRAADDVGRKYVDQQVYRALHSGAYHSILAKIAKLPPAQMSFRKADVVPGLTEEEKRKFSNFLHRMKVLKVIRSGDVAGEYVFNMRMARFYIWLDSIRKDKQRA
jgi:hypothetical protein